MNLNALLGGRHFYRLFLLFIATIGFASPALASLSFELRTGISATGNQTLSIDSNKCPVEGPTSAFVGGLVTNNGGSAVSNAVASINGLNGNVFLTGGQAASQTIGTLNAGESIAVYWFVGYSCSTGAVVTPTISMTSSAGTQSAGLTLTIKSAISANAGGNVIGSLLGPGAVVGQTIALDIDYDFGGTGAGDEYFLQPSGSQDFNAACFRLIGTEITASNLNAATLGQMNRLYFVQPSAQPGNNYNISVRYFFEYLCAGQSTSARPYAVQSSGTKNKYTGNFDGAGAVAISFPGATNPFTITKSVSESAAFVGATGNLIYTVTITNPSNFTAILGSIVDVLPPGMSFVALEADSDVTLANSSATPSNGAAGTLEFKGLKGQSYLVPANNGSVALKYSVSRPPDAGDFTNSAQGVFGLATTPVATATYNQSVPIPLAVTKTSVIVSDPVRGGTNPLAIPMAVIDYTIEVTNPNAAAIDEDSLYVTDSAPPNAKMCLADIGGNGPVEFANGAPTSNLTYTYLTLLDLTDDLDFSEDDGATWDYEPALDGDGCDENISDFRINPAGAFAGNGSFKLNVFFIII